MPIIGTDPLAWEHANVVLVDTNASTNRDAILEIEASDVALQRPRNHKRQRNAAKGD